ncbi:GlsB/YeaQ/YmgE family stress response membrane protein [Desulfovibrio sp. G11]
MTSLLGIVGACVGGFIGTSLGFGKVTGFNLPSFFIAVLGAMIVSRFQVQSATPSPWVLASSKKTS